MWRCALGSVSVSLLLLVAMAHPSRAAGGSAPVRGPAAAPVRPDDFNGDGYADLAVTALYEDVGSVVDEGAVNVLYGSASGVQADDPADQFWTGGLPGVEALAEQGSQFGWCTAAGNFNGDGYGDLAICVPFLDVNGVADAGAVEVLYGSGLGLQADGVGGPDDQLWTQDSPDVQDQAATGELLGRAVTSGDFNADGFADLAIDVRSQNVNAATEAGAVVVLYGSSGGLQANGVGGPDDQLWTQDSPGVLNVAETRDWFGRGLTSGDFNADGYADLAAGVFLEDVTTITDAGGVEVLYGSAAGLQANGFGGPNDQFWTQDSSGVEDRAEAGDYFGHTVMPADFNGDGFTDLAIASRLEDVVSKANAGGVEVLYGSATGLQAGAPADQWWTQATADVQDDPRAADQFGFSLAPGDYNGDGFADLAIGVPFKNIQTGLDDAGQVAVLYGSGAGLQATGVGGPDDQIWTQNSPDVRDDAEAHDELGIAVASADFNGDSVADLAIGVHDESLGSIAEAGAVAVLYGSVGGGIQAVSPDDQVWTQDSAGVQDDAEPGDELGWWVT